MKEGVIALRESLLGAGIFKKNFIVLLFEIVPQRAQSVPYHSSQCKMVLSLFL